MSVLLKQARIIAPHSPHNGQIQDIFINNGIIEQIAPLIDIPATYVINEPGVCISIGWVDLFAHFCDPGLEYRETIESGAAAAAAGGFTDVAVLPNTQPALHSKAQVSYVKQKAQGMAVTLHPIGSITKNTEGKELAEMYDMRQAGAIAFSDGLHPIQEPGIVLKALQYVRAFDGVIIQIPNDKSIGAQGLMNEGIISTQLGLPGKPAIAEELMIARDIELVRYTNGQLHITGITTAKGVELITAAKKEGLRITCSVSPWHLNYCDEDLQGYDTNLKLSTPLRTATDRAALQQALQNGVIDCMASHHLPQHSDAKDCEFEYAAPGMIGLQTVFANALAAGISPEQFVIQQSITARQIAGLPLPALETGAAACITIFNPTASSRFTTENNQSLSHNSVLLNTTLTGAVRGIINNGKEIIYAA